MRVAFASMAWNTGSPFHQQFLPCFEAEDSTAGDLLHCGISKEPSSAVGQNAKYSRRAHVFRSTPNIGHSTARLARSFRADCVAKVIEQFESTLCACARF